MVWRATALPYGIWRLYMACRGNPMRFGIAMVSLGTNMACFGWSAAFHMGSWSMPVEIALQKLDHCWISLWCVGMMFPTGLLILPRLNGGVLLGLIMIGLAAGFCCVNCWFVLQSKPSTLRHCLVPGSIVPFLPFMYWSMTEAEWLYTWGVILSMMCGTYVYAVKWDMPGIDPRFAGHHELLHILSCVASTCVYLLSFSACST